MLFYLIEYLLNCGPNIDNLVFNVLFFMQSYYLV